MGCIHGFVSCVIALGPNFPLGGYTKHSPK